MYSPYDPRSKMASSGSPTSGAGVGFAAAEYVKFYELPPSEKDEKASTWYGRGQNFVVAYTEARAGAVLKRETQPDEYVLLIPDRSTSVRVSTPQETHDVPGYSLVILPPGPSSISVTSGGTLVRVFSARNTDLANKAHNAVSYEQPHPHIPPFRPWPDPPGGFRVRVYSLDVPPVEGRFGRIWRCTTLMINVLPLEHGPRDVTRLSPHFHDDFEQCSLALQGRFTHHIRWPWTANYHHWRADDHEVCRAPSIAVIPPPAIHTSAAMDAGTNHLVDIFSPPRLDFSKMQGWVLNADEYPMPEGS
jgi:hypothetical protein